MYWDRMKSQQPLKNISTSRSDVYQLAVYHKQVKKNYVLKHMHSVGY